MSDMTQDETLVFTDPNGAPAELPVEGEIDPTPAPAPKARKRSKPAATMAQAVEAAAPPVLEQPARESPLDQLIALQAKTVKVFRDGPPRYRGAQVQTGYAATLPLNDQIEETIYSQFGGGDYTLVGRATNGRTVNAQLRLPGEPLALRDEDDDRDDDDDRRPSFPLPQGSPPPFVPPYDSPFGGGNFGGPGMRPGGPHYGAYYPSALAELEALKGKVAEANASLARERSEHEKTRLALEAERAERRLEEQRREHERGMAALRQELAEIRAAATAPKGPDVTTTMLEFFKLQAAERSARAGKDEQALAQVQAQQQQFLQSVMQQHQSTLQAMLASKGGGMAETLSMLEAAKRLGGNPMEQFTTFLELQERMRSNSDDDDEEEDKGPLDRVLSTVERVITTRAQPVAPPAAPQPQEAPPQQLPPPPQEKPMSLSEWGAILDQFVGHYQKKTAPESAAAAIKTFCLNAGLATGVRTLAQAQVPAILQSLEGAAGQVPAFLPQAKTLKTVVEVLKTPEGAQWAAGVFAALKQGLSVT